MRSSLVSIRQHFFWHDLPADPDTVVLRNPVYFIFLIILAIAAYVTYTLNLWGPMLKMANAASQQALEEGKKRLREFLEENPTARQAIAMSSSSSREEYEMKNLHSRTNKIKTDGADEEDVDDI